MPEPAKDTAIEITPKTEASSVRVPRIVAEINRVASRVRDRNKKEEEEEDNDDAEVLENDAPTPSQKPVDIQIIRENTIPRVGVSVCLRVVLCLLLIVNCVFLVRIDDGIRTGGVNTGLGIWTNESPPPPPPPHPSRPPPPPPPPLPPLNSGTISTQTNAEYKIVTWIPSILEGYTGGDDCYDIIINGECTLNPSDTSSGFIDVVKREGVSHNEIYTDCSYSTCDISRCDLEPTGTAYSSATTLSRNCVVEKLVNKLGQDGWIVMNTNLDDVSTVSFTRTNSTVSSSRTPSPVVSGTVPLHDDTFYTAVSMCLGEEPYFGLCENEGVSTGFGTMPAWNTSLITTMKGLFQNNYNFNGDLSAWIT